jgi:hypothetical protein
MPRKGKDVEEIVEKLHKLILGPEWDIKSPDRIKDKITGQSREVDVSIRLKSGHISILIIVECRDRDIEDVTWIEQLVTKCKNLGADKLVAVSSTGFTEPAKKSAEHYGIVTQVLSKITPDDIKSWLYGSSVGTLHRFYRFVYFRSDVRGYVTSHIEVNEDTVLLFENEKYCFNDIFRIEVLEKQPDIFSDVGIDGSKTIKIFDLPIPNKYSIQADTLETYNIERFVFEVELWYEQQKIPFSEMFRLGDGDNITIEWAETEPIDDANGQIKFSLSKKKGSDGMNIGIEFLH